MLELIYIVIALNTKEIQCFYWFLSVDFDGFRKLNLKEVNGPHPYSELSVLTENASYNEGCNLTANKNEEFDDAILFCC